MNKITREMYSNWKLRKNTVHKEWKHIPTKTILRFKIIGRYAPYTKTNYTIYEVTLVAGKEVITLYEKVTGEVVNKLEYLKILRNRILKRIKRFMVKTNGYTLGKLKAEKQHEWKRV